MVEFGSIVIKSIDAGGKPIPSPGKGLLGAWMIQEFAFELVSGTESSRFLEGKPDDVDISQTTTITKLQLIHLREAMSLRK